MFLAATLAFLRLSGAAAKDSKDNIQMAGRLESWVKKEYFETSTKCQPELISTTQYYKLSGFCFNGNTEVSCHNDPTGITNGILLVSTDYGYDSQCHGSPTDINSQNAYLKFDWPTSCEEDSDDSSYRYSCINLPGDQLPFNVEEPNTLATLGFYQSNCAMDVENVQGAKIRHINKCESNDDAFDQGHSRKISDCGFLWEYFSDYDCQNRVDFDHETYDSDFECYNDRRLEYVGNDFYTDSPNYRGWWSELTFCAGGNYGAYANQKDEKKKKADVAVSLSNDMNFNEEATLFLNKQFFLKEADVADVASASVPETSVSQLDVTPMNYAYLGSVAFIGIVIGAVVSAKFFKSRNQFEGVEMLSAHSNI